MALRNAFLKVIVLNLVKCCIISYAKPISDLFSEFLANYKFSKSFNYIFEGSSSKVSSRNNIRVLKVSRHAAISRNLQTEGLNI